MFGREIEFAFFDKNRAISRPLNASLQLATMSRGGKSAYAAPAFTPPSLSRAITQNASSAVLRTRVSLARARHTAHRRRNIFA